MDIYPAIDLKEGQCVRLEQGRFDAVTTYGANPVEMAQRWKEQGARLLHVVDLDGARLGQPSEENRLAVREIVRQVGLPVQFGGGVRDQEAVARMLEVGVARVVVGTAAARDPKLAETLFATYGEQVAVGLDARDGLVAISGWQEYIGERAVHYVARMAEMGARRFIFTDIARDGMLSGVNIEALAQILATVPHLPVIASGGVATLDDLDALLRLRVSSAPNLEGVIIGKALYAGTVSLPEVLARTEAAR